MEDEDEKQTKRQRAEYYSSLPEDYDEANDRDIIDAEDRKGSFEAWINLEAVRKYIRHHMNKFITLFR